MDCTTDSWPESAKVLSEMLGRLAGGDADVALSFLRERQGSARANDGLRFPHNYGWHHKRLQIEYMVDATLRPEQFRGLTWALTSLILPARNTTIATMN